MSRLGSGKVLGSQARNIVLNVYLYLAKAKTENNLNYNVANSTSEATGVSVRLVYNIVKEGKTVDAAQQIFSTPSNKSKDGEQKILSVKKENRSQLSVSVPGTSYQNLNNVVTAVDTKNVFTFRPEEPHSTQNIFPFKLEEPRSEVKEVENKNVVAAANTQNIFPFKTEEPHSTQNIFPLRPEEPSSVVTEIENKNHEHVDDENVAHFSQEESRSDAEMENKVEPRLSEDNIRVDLSPGISVDSVVEYDTLVKVSFGVQTDNTIITVTKEQQTDSDSAVENEQHKTNDECQIFGDLIASELRNTKFDKDRRKLRWLILREIVTVLESEQRMD